MSNIWIIHAMKKRWLRPLDIDLDPEIRNLKSHSVRRVAVVESVRESDSVMLVVGRAHPLTCSHDFPMNFS